MCTLHSPINKCFSAITKDASFTAASFTTAMMTLAMSECSFHQTDKITCILNMSWFCPENNRNSSMNLREPGGNF